MTHPTLDQMEALGLAGMAAENHPTHRGKHKRVGDFSFISLWHPIVRRALGDCLRCGINSNMMAG